MISTIVNFLHTVFNLITNTLHSFIVLVYSIANIPVLIQSVTVYFPAIVTTAILTTISILTIKFVIGR